MGLFILREPVFFGHSPKGRTYFQHEDVITTTPTTTTTTFVPFFIV